MSYRARMLIPPEMMNSANGSAAPNHVTGGICETDIKGAHSDES